MDELEQHLYDAGQPGYDPTRLTIINLSSVTNAEFRQCLSMTWRQRINYQRSYQIINGSINSDKKFQTIGTVLRETEIEALEGQLHSEGTSIQISDPHSDEVLGKVDQDTGPKQITGKRLRGQSDSAEVSPSGLPAAKRFRLRSSRDDEGARFKPSIQDGKSSLDHGFPAKARTIGQPTRKRPIATSTMDVAKYPASKIYTDEEKIEKVRANIDLQVKWNEQQEKLSVMRNGKMMLLVNLKASKPVKVAHCTKIQTFYIKLQRTGSSDAPSALLFVLEIPSGQSETISNFCNIFTSRVIAKNSVSEEDGAYFVQKEIKLESARARSHGRVEGLSTSENASFAAKPSPGMISGYNEGPPSSTDHFILTRGSEGPQPSDALEHSSPPAWNNLEERQRQSK